MIIEISWQTKSPILFTTPHLSFPKFWLLSTTIPFLTVKHPKNLQTLHIQFITILNHTMQHYEKGCEYFSDEYYTQAIQSFTQAIKVDHKMKIAYTFRGNIYHLLKKYKEAVNDFSEAVRVDPKYVKGYNNRGNAYRAMEKYNQAIADYSEALKLDSKNASTYYNRGIAYNDLKKYKEAIFDYTIAINYQPRNALYLNNRGVTYYQMKKYPEAIEDYTMAINIDPSFFRAYNNRGNAFKSQKKYSQAIADYSQVIRMEANNAMAYYNRGIVYTTIKEYSKAIEDFTQTVRLDPKNALAFNNRGVAYYDIKKYSQAYQDYTQAIKIDPLYVRAINNRGNVLDDMRQRHQAEKDYMTALQLLSNNPLFMFNLAKCYLDLNDKAKANQFYRQGISYFQQVNELILKQKFMMTDVSLNMVKIAIEQYRTRKSEVEQLQQVAKQKSRDQLYQPVAKLSQINLNYSIKYTVSVSKDKDKLSINNKPYQNLRKEFNNQLEELRRKLREEKRQSRSQTAGSHQMEYRDRRSGNPERGHRDQRTIIKDQLRIMQKNIYPMQQTIKKIKSLNQQNQRQYYELLYYMMIDHFIAYRILASKQLNADIPGFKERMDALQKLCTYQELIQKDRVLEDLVLIPFNIINKYKQVNGSYLSPVINQKMKKSNFLHESQLNVYLSYVIDHLIENKQFNQELMAALNDEDEAYLNRYLEYIGKAKGYTYSKIFRKTEKKIDYIQEVVVAQMAVLAWHLYQVKSAEFRRVSEDKGLFFNMILYKLSPAASRETQETFRTNESTAVVIRDNPNNRLMPQQPAQQTQPHSQGIIGQLCCCVSNKRRNN